MSFKPIYLRTCGKGLINAFVDHRTPNPKLALQLRDRLASGVAQHHLGAPKAGVPVELGVKVCILEGPHQFILHHQGMQKQTDDQITLERVAQAKKRFPHLNACSFDKGFDSPANQLALKEQLELVALPRKGKWSQQAQQQEQAAPFVKARRAHSAVESAINGLEVHGLDVCPDHGIEGFKRYVALAVVARNIHRIGAIVWQQEKAQERRKTKYADRDTTYKLAA